MSIILLYSTGEQDYYCDDYEIFDNEDKLLEFVNNHLNINHKDYDGNFNVTFCSKLYGSPILFEPAEIIRKYKIK